MVLQLAVGVGRLVISGSFYSVLPVQVYMLSVVTLYTFPALEGVHGSWKTLFACLLQLSFPKGLSSAPGRPRVPPMSPVVFDVKLLYIPGLEEDEE